MKNVINGALVILVIIAVICGIFVMMGGQTGKMSQAVRDSGYTEVEIGGHAWFAGSDNDTFANHFTARNAQSNMVSGIVTGGPIKGYTVRMGR